VHRYSLLIECIVLIPPPPSLRCIEEYTKLNRLKDEALKFISQEYTGRSTDITLWPALQWGDMTWRILCHPTEPEMARFILGGRRMCWPRLQRIKTQCRLERALRKCALELGVPIVG
jgi:hypothetical protein